MQKQIEILDGEYWWGGCAFDGCSMPYGKETEFSRGIDPNSSPNQAVPLLLSSRGRYIWCDTGFDIHITGGVITLTYTKNEPALWAAGTTLKEAYTAASSRFFPASGQCPPKELFSSPQYNTWIELMYEQNQVQILQYARDVLAHGLPPGVLMIDSGWSNYCGHMGFDGRKFPDPKAMVKELHDLGFQVMLWVCPFISCDTVTYRHLLRGGLLLMEQNGEPAIRNWWDGYSAVLDLSNPAARTWFTGELDRLMETYGIDGFKFDGGDAFYYKDTDITYGGVDANTQSRLWGELGLAYAYNEFRACYGCGGLPLVQRLCDKKHSWGTEGIAGIIPSALALGLIGHPFSCPDMIGGGEYLNFLENSDRLDSELFIRHAECAALMPMMQFSAAPWRVLSGRSAALCLGAVALRQQYAARILELAAESSKNGQPMIRCLEYEFPHQGLHDVTDQFLLGDGILVAPQVNKGQTERAVRLPSGSWRGPDGTLTDGPRTITAAAPPGTVPVYIREK